jgi:uncharacterized protein YukE
MPRIIGNIGTPINGKLYVKPSAPFLGVEGGYRSYDVADGLIDIELAPTPRGVFYLVDFQAEGSFGNPSPQEKWVIPPEAEIALDSLRFPRQRRSPQTITKDFSARELKLLRQEAVKLQQTVNELQQLLTQTQAEVATSNQKLESARAEVAALKTKLYLAECPTNTVVEKIVEVPIVERISDQAMARENQTLDAMVTELRAENDKLMAQLHTAIASIPVPVAPEPKPQRRRVTISATASPAEQLDYLLRQREGTHG